MIHLLTLVLSMFAVAPAAREKEETLTTAVYFPLQVGNQWQYQLDTQGQKIQLTNKVAKQEKIDNQKLFRVETEMNGQVAATEHLNHTAKGLMRHRFNGLELDPPLALLKNPIVLGESWETKTQMGGQKINIKCQLDEKKEDVKVPAGEFETLKLLVETEVNGQPIASTYWFAEKVGFVKQNVNIAGNSVDVELLKFEPAPVNATSKVQLPEENSPQD